ncbi:MAG TPA: hypothetical protein VIR81_08465 [Myxococcales bacterium]
MTLLATLVAAGHLYLFQWPDQPARLLMLLPSEGEDACGVGPVNFGPSDNSWSSGSAGTHADCTFRQSVAPGSLLPVWVDAGKAQPGLKLEVAWTLAGGGARGKSHSATLETEPAPLDGLKASPAGLHATATKVKGNVRVELRNGGSGLALLGDAVAARTRPKDACLGNGPQVLLKPGETLVDLRPGLLSPSMQVWAAAFTGPKACRWVEIRRGHGG